MSSRSRSGEVYSIQHYVIKFVSDLRQVRFLRVLLTSFTNKTDCYDISEILLKMAFEAITLIPKFYCLVPQTDFVNVLTIYSDKRKIIFQHICNCDQLWVTEDGCMTQTIFITYCCKEDNFHIIPALYGIFHITCHINPRHPY